YDAATMLLAFEVRDTGIGMSPAQLDSVRKFAAFNQADSTTTRRFGGSGLGIRISNMLTGLMGGSFSIDSTEKLGTLTRATIRVAVNESAELLTRNEYLARAAAGHRSDRTTTQDSTSELLRDVRVLLAEDGRDNQRLISLLLRKAGASVEFAQNGQEAVELAQARMAEDTCFDVILMDMQMPVMDGATATRELRQLGCTTPILALSAHAMPAARAQFELAGCDAFLTKPINRQALIACVARHVQDRSRYMISR
ncbi:MAG: response regulator, partial [Planctomycetales bacterium]|nr:response regulator [Planctomycetales bacterium]